MPTDRPSWSPEHVDPTTPSIARVYDYYLGGSHNFASDREFGDRALSAFPDMTIAVRENREYLRRVVTYLCGEGIDQFLDLGSGIPTVGNVHEIAQELDPRARVVYVDHDPVAATHGQTLLADNPLAAAMQGDLLEPATMLEDVRAGGVLDLSRPVAVLLFYVLHLVPDSAEPAARITQYTSAMAPGSYLAVSQASRPPKAVEEDANKVVKVYERDDSPSRVWLRDADEMEVFFDGLELVSPGLVPIHEWRPDPEHQEKLVINPGIAGVGRKA